MQANDKPLAFLLSHAQFASAIEKGYECCIQCETLANCDKELWKTFPKHREGVIEMQKNIKQVKGFLSCFPRSILQIILSFGFALRLYRSIISTLSSLLLFAPALVDTELE
jgi:hypothetical protein